MAKRTGRMNRKQHTVKGQYYRVFDQTGSLHQGRIEDRFFRDWLKGAASFTFSRYANHRDDGWILTVRRERRRSVSFWYAYKTVGGRTFKVYIGGDDTLTYGHLFAAVARMMAKIESRSV